MNYYRDFQASLFKFCTQMAVDMKNLSIVDAKIFKWDAHADIEVLPDQDLLGPMEFSMVGNEGTYIITSMVAMSTRDDTNLDRLDKMLNYVHDKIQPDNTFPIVDALSGAPRGVMKFMDGVGILPVLNTRIRPVKAISFQAGTGLSRGL